MPGHAGACERHRALTAGPYPGRAALDAARRAVVDLLETGRGPFAQDWATWQRDPGWPALRLPT